MVVPHSDRGYPTTGNGSAVIHTYIAGMRRMSCRGQLGILKFNPSRSVNTPDQFRYVGVVTADNYVIIGESKLKKRKLLWYGHVSRHNSSSNELVKVWWDREVTLASKAVAGQYQKRLAVIDHFT